MRPEKTPMRTSLPTLMLVAFVALANAAVAVPADLSASPDELAAGTSSPLGSACVYVDLGEPMVYPRTGDGCPE